MTRMFGICASVVLSLVSFQEPARAQNVTLAPPALPPVATREFNHVYNKPLDLNTDLTEALALLAGGDHINLLVNVLLTQNYGSSGGSAGVGQLRVTIVSDEECSKLSIWTYGQNAKEVCVKLVTAAYVDPQNRAVQAAAVQAVQDVSSSLGTKIDAQSKTIDLLQKRLDALERARPRR